MRGCTICGEKALHYLKYERLYDDYVVWEGDYCLKHFVEKIGEMTRIYRKRLKEMH
jgi:hypothetical protein